MKQTLDGETIYSVYGLDGTLYFRDNITTGETTDYVRMGSHTVGRMDETGAFTWTHNDHLGSVAVATDAAGALVFWESHTPFGEPLQDPAANRDEAGFTGHIRDAATGLTYAQARYYNPVIARFYAPDPVGFAGGGPGYFNRYAYTMNDPVNLVDPTGMSAAPAAGRQQAVRQAVRCGRFSAAACVGAGVITVVAIQNQRHSGQLRLNLDPPSPIQISESNGEAPDWDDIEDNKPPFTGRPGSTVRGGTGSRHYGDDGYPETDRDLPHPDHAPPGNGDHVHDWERPEDGGPPTHEDRGPPREPRPDDPPEPRGPNTPPE